MPAACNMRRIIIAFPKGHRGLLLFLFIVLLANSCDKTPVKPVFEGYPTVYHRLQTEVYNARLAAFWARNPAVRSNIDAFGFCTSDAGNRSLPRDSFARVITAQDALRQAKKFAAMNPDETGVADTSQLEINQVDQYLASDGYYVTMLQCKIQYVDTLEVAYSHLSFRFENDSLVECEGNWFPVICIPSAFRLNREQAVQGLLGQDDSYNGWNGPVERTIQSTDLENTTVTVCICQLNSSGNQIELHVAYRILLYAAANIFYVDVMSGEIIGREPKFSAK